MEINNNNQGNDANNNNGDYLTRLPADVLQNIFKYIPTASRTKTCVNLRRASKGAYSLGTDELLKAIIDQINTALLALQERILQLQNRASQQQNSVLTSVFNNLPKYHERLTVVQNRVRQQQQLRQALYNQDPLPFEVKQQLVALVPLTSELLNAQMLLNAVKTEDIRITSAFTYDPYRDPLRVNPVPNVPFPFMPDPLNPTPFAPQPPIFPQPGPYYGEPTPDELRPPGFDDDYGARDLDPLGIGGAPFPYGGGPFFPGPGGRGRGRGAFPPPNPNMPPPNPFNPHPNRPTGPRWL